jgi:hypothetical protein
MFWHPFTVALAWRKLYGKWPDRYEWCAIFCHDLGYWGCSNMDGKEGHEHPVKGAMRAGRLADWVSRKSGNPVLHSILRGNEACELSLLHSREYAKLHGLKPSALCWADKFCCFYDPTWFYLLRAHLSGEIYEFRANAVGHIPDEFTYADWYCWYRLKILWLPEIQSLLASRRRSCIFPF